MINKEKFKKLVDLAYELEKLGADVFLSYHGHVKTIEIHVYLRGWNRNVKTDYSNECYFENKSWALEIENIDDCINSLKEMIDKEKRRKDV